MMTAISALAVVMILAMATYLCWALLIRFRRPIDKALIVANEEGIILEAKGDIEKVCGWTSHELVGQAIPVLIPHPMREGHIVGMEHYRKTGAGPVIGSPLKLQALDPDGQTLHPVWLTVLGYEKYSELVYGLMESRW